MPVPSELKDKIVSHSRERFFREGFAKISVDELTTELAMSKKTFYQVFGSKNDLVEEIVERKLAEINAAMDEILSADADFVHKFQSFLIYISGTIGMMSKAILSDMQKHQPRLWTRIEKFRRERLTKNITLFLEQGTREGFIREDVNGKVFLLSLLSSVESIVQPGVLMNESFSAKEAVQAIMDVFFRGILTERGRKQFAKVRRSKHSVLQ